MLSGQCQLPGQITTRSCHLRASCRPQHALQIRRHGRKRATPALGHCQQPIAVSSTTSQAAARVAPRHLLRSPVQSYPFFRRRSLRHLGVTCSAASASHGGSDQHGAVHGARDGSGGVLDTVRHEIAKLNGQWDKFIPMILVSTSPLLIPCFGPVARTLPKLIIHM